MEPRIRLRQPLDTQRQLLLRQGERYAQEPLERAAHAKAGPRRNAHAMTLGDRGQRGRFSARQFRPERQTARWRLHAPVRQLLLDLPDQMIPPRPEQIGAWPPSFPALVLLGGGGII